MMKNDKKTEMDRARYVFCILVIATVLFSGYSCNNKNKMDALYNTLLGNNYEIVTGYKNFYEDDSVLVRVEVTKKMPGKSDHEEWIYTYNPVDKKLQSVKKYEIEKGGSRELYACEEYQGNMTTKLYLKGTDTILFRQTLVDERGNVVRHITKDRVPESLYSDNWVDIDEEKEFEYNDENRLVFSRRNDHTKKQVEINRFVYETVGDTLIEKTFENDSLQSVMKKFGPDNHKTRIDYSADNRIEMIQERINLGPDTLLIVSALSEEGFIVSELSQMGSLDSLYIVKGKEVKSVLILPEHKSVTTFDYDKYGNITREVNTKYFH